jgi:hypothetical protein
MLPSGTTADDVIWQALRSKFPEQMDMIEELQRSMSDIDRQAEHYIATGVKSTK